MQLKNSFLYFSNLKMSASNELERFLLTCIVRYFAHVFWSLSYHVLLGAAAKHKTRVKHDIFG